MKKIFKYLLIALLLNSTSLLAKNNNASALESLKSTAGKYKALQLSADMEKSLDYIYPAVFTVTPKEMLLSGFKMAKESGKLPKISAFNQTFDKPIEKYSKGLYTIVPYTMKMQMDITPPNAEKSKMLKNPKEIEQFKSFTLNMLKMSLGEDALIESKEGSMLIDIKKDGQYLAIQEKGKDWKFVDLAPMAVAQIKSVLPQDIVAKEKKIFDVKAVSPQDQIKAMMEMMMKKAK